MIRKQLHTRVRSIITWAGGWVGPLPKPEKWLFIVGCYNSGTSLLKTLLARHPQIGSMRWEGQFCTNQFTVPKYVGLPRLWALEPEKFFLDETSQTDIDVNRLKRQWGTWINEIKRPVLMEKTPTNVARLRWLQANFENAHFLGIIRNGYAVAEGIRRKVDHPLKLGALQWQRSNKMMLEGFETLNNALLIKYEDLTDSPDKILSNIMSFLELPKEKMESVKGRVFSIHGLESELINMNGRSLNVLSEEEKVIIENVAGDLLRQLGYTQP